MPVSLVYANTVENSTLPTLEVDGVTYPDWETLSLADLGSVVEEGGFDFSGQDLGEYNAAEVVEYLGYDPSRSWRAGDKAASLLKLGDFAPVSTLPNWSLNTVQRLVGLNLGDFRLSDFGALQGKSLDDLITVLPRLGLSALGDVSPMFDVVSSVVGVSEALKWVDQPIEELGGLLRGDGFTLSQISLDQINLSDYRLDSLPGIEDVPFGDFGGWKGLSLDQIPGLEYVPIAKMMWGLVNGGFLGKLDIVWGDKEANRTNTISGSYKEGFNVPCNQDNCAHIEMADAIKVISPVLKGKQWISGKSQQVKGGSGVLRFIHGGKEPTGRHPFGDLFKVVLTDVDESRGLARFGIYFRFCVNGWFFKGCSPYIIGPLPWFSHKEKDLVFVGVDGMAADPSYYGNVPGYPGIPSGILADPRVQGMLNGLVDDGQGNFTPAAALSYDGTIPSSDCTEFRGVNMAAFKRAMAMKESGGQTNPNGDYYAVGVYVKADGGKNRGHALGKYQYMTYRADVARNFRGEQGKAILSNAWHGVYQSHKTPLTEAIARYFPPDKQEALADKEFTSLIEEAYRQGLRTESQLVNQAATWHWGGRGYREQRYTDYSRDVWRYYQQQKPIALATCSQQNGGDCPQTSYGHFEYPIAPQSQLVQVGEYKGRPEYLHSEAATAFNAMINDAASAGVNLQIISGFRSKESQSLLWDRQVKRRGGKPQNAAKVSAPPGYSENHTGYAVDLGSVRSSRDDLNTDLKASFGNTQAFAWLKSNAGNYGFELSFPKNNKQGISYEPWHWRFVGSEQASKLFEGAKRCSVRSNTLTACSAGSLLSLVWPAQGPITSGFGQRNGRLHAGTDIGNVRGTPIRAAATGKVLRVVTDCVEGNLRCSGRNAGNLVDLEHCNGAVTRYLHLHPNTIQVRKGQVIQQGQVFAGMGNTGGSTGPHLHFEYYPTGRANGAVDPVSHLPRR